MSEDFGAERSGAEKSESAGEREGNRPSQATDFDPSLYTQPPPLDVPAAYSVGVALIAAAPQGEPLQSKVRKAGRALRDAVLSLRESWSATAKVAAPDRRSIDVVADASWRALSLALESVTLVTGTPEDDRNAASARQIVKAVFTDGLSFTQLPYASQWSHADRYLKEIDQRRLGPEIDALVGPRYLAFVRRAHAAYGEALKAVESSNGGRAGVREPLRRVQVAIQEYAFALFAEYPPSSEAEHHPRLRKALAPLDKFRTTRAGGSIAPPAASAEPAGPPPADPIPEIS